MTNNIDILRSMAKAKDSFRQIARSTGIDRNTVRNYLRLAATHGFDDTTSDDRLAEIASAVIRSVHGGEAKDPELGACALLHPHRELLSGWLENDHLTLAKTHIKLGRMGVSVTYSTLYRYAREELGFGGQKVTVRMADTEPGEVAQLISVKWDWSLTQRLAETGYPGTNLRMVYELVSSRIPGNQEF